jgi:hypothetical protein
MNGPGPGAHRSGLVMGFYTARYIVGIFVMSFPNEARYIVGIFVTSFPNEDRYSLISVCNEL